MSIFNHLIRIVGGLCIASLFFIAMSCDLSGPDKPTSGVTTLAGGSMGFVNAIGRDAKFDTPRGLALSEDEQTLYIADARNNCIRSLDIASRNVSTLAGECSRTSSGKLNGVGATARFTFPGDLAFHDGTLYVADNNSIRQINVETKTVSPLGLTGTPFADTSISGLAVKPDGSKLYFLDSRKGRIREIDLAASTKTLRTLVGPNTTGNIGPENGGPAVGAPVDGKCFGVPHAVLPLVDDKCPAALFNQPKGMMITPDGRGLIIADDPMSTHILRKQALSFRCSRPTRPAHWSIESRAAQTPPLTRFSAPKLVSFSIGVV